jgi:[FeFe] hydrogenase H-cluster maturation GTPase HydF
MNAILTPRGERQAIVFFGLRNAGKSSLMNRLFQREVSIVSPEAGTTTDPVARAIELGRLGPATIWDTAGIDDEGGLGRLRVEKTRAALGTASIAVLVTRADLPPAPAESELAAAALGKGIPLIAALTFDDARTDDAKTAWLADLGAAAIVKADNLSGRGSAELREALASLADRVAPEPGLFEGLVDPDDLVVLVAPIDSGTPKGRLILPQVEAIRDLLDRGARALVVRDGLRKALDGLVERPRLVVTDSQVFGKVAAELPDDLPLTSFSILLARKKGDLSAYLAGVRAIAGLPDEARILVLEACSHHRQEEDIGTVKIPRIYHEKASTVAVFDFARELPTREKLAGYSLVITCGGCMRTRAEMQGQLARISEAGVASTNYGIFLAWANGLLPRAVEPFREWRTARAESLPAIG